MLVVEALIKSSPSASCQKTVFLSETNDNSVPFDSVVKSRLWHYLLTSKVPEKHVSVRKQLHHHISDRFRDYGQLSPPSTTSSGARKMCQVSAFLFNSVIEFALQNALSGHLDGEIELPSGNRVFSFEHIDDIALMSHGGWAILHVLERLSIVISVYPMFPIYEVQCCFKSGTRLHLHSPLWSVFGSNPFL